MTSKTMFIGHTIFFYLFPSFGVELIPVVIYLLTAIGLSPLGSTHLHTNNKQNDTNTKRTTQIKTNVE